MVRALRRMRQMADQNNGSLIPKQSPRTRKENQGSDQQRGAPRTALGRVNLLKSTPRPIKRRLGEPPPARGADDRAQYERGKLR